MVSITQVQNLGAYIETEVGGLGASVESHLENEGAIIKSGNVSDITKLENYATSTEAKASTVLTHVKNVLADKPETNYMLIILFVLAVIVIIAVI